MIVGAIAAVVLACLLLACGIVLLTRRDERVCVWARALGERWQFGRGVVYDVDFSTSDGQYIRTEASRDVVPRYPQRFPGCVGIDPGNPYDARIGRFSRVRLAGVIALGFAIAMFAAAGILFFIGTIQSAVLGLPATPAAVDAPITVTGAAHTSKVVFA